MPRMRTLPCNVYDVEQGSRYENKEPLLACRKTVKHGQPYQDKNSPMNCLGFQGKGNLRSAEGINTLSHKLKPNAVSLSLSIPYLATEL